MTPADMAGDDTLPEMYPGLRGFLALIVLLGLAAQTVAPNRASGPGFSVQVEHAVKTRLPDNRDALSIRYRFDFSNLRTVRVRGLGDVPPSGSYSYVTTESALSFIDPATSRTLAEVPLEPTVVVAAQPPLTEIPASFPDQARRFGWDASKPLQPHANDILNQHFRYKPYDQDGVHFIATTFATFPIPHAPEGNIGLVAIQLSFPYDPNAKTFSLRVQSIVREGRELSKVTKPAESPAVLQAADSFIDGIIGEIRSRSGQR